MDTETDIFDCAHFGGGKWNFSFDSIAGKLCNRRRQRFSRRLSYCARVRVRARTCVFVLFVRLLK